MTIRIVTDSTCDLDPTVAQDLDITVLPLYINVDRQSYRDGVDLTRQAFYEHLPNWSESPRTAAPSPNVFTETYCRVAQEQGADEILSLHISESLSGTVSVARIGAAQCDTVDVTVMDAQQLSLGTGYLAVAAAKAAREGASMLDIVAMLQRLIRRVHVFAALDTLEYLKRSGRMHWAVAHIGEILSIKPILRMYRGDATVSKVRTRGAAMRRMVQWLGELGPLEQVSLVHTNAPQAAAELRELASDTLPDGDVPLAQVTPVLGAHLGPGTVGFACVQAYE